MSWIEKLGISDARDFHFGVQHEEDALLFEALDLLASELLFLVLLSTA